MFTCPHKHTYADTLTHVHTHAGTLSKTSRVRFMYLYKYDLYKKNYTCSMLAVLSRRYDERGNKRRRNGRNGGNWKELLKGRGRWGDKHRME